MDPKGEKWTVPTSQNRGVMVPSGWRSEVGAQPSAATLKVERQMYLDRKAFFRWTGWKVRNFAMFGIVVPGLMLLAMSSELVPPRFVVLLMLCPLTVQEKRTEFAPPTMNTENLRATGRKRCCGGQAVQAHGRFPELNGALCFINILQKRGHVVFARGSSLCKARSLSPVSSESIRLTAGCAAIFFSLLMPLVGFVPSFSWFNMLR